MLMVVFLLHLLELFPAGDGKKVKGVIGYATFPTLALEGIEDALEVGEQLSKRRLLSLDQ